LTQVGAQTTQLDKNVFGSYQPLPQFPQYDQEQNQDADLDGHYEQDANQVT
jgi:hypothetical protein